MMYKIHDFSALISGVPTQHGAHFNGLVAQVTHIWESAGTWWARVQRDGVSAHIGIEFLHPAPAGK